jgi:hypothetical protein
LHRIRRRRNCTSHVQANTTTQTTHATKHYTTTANRENAVATDAAPPRQEPQPARNLGRQLGASSSAPRHGDRPPKLARRGMVDGGACQRRESGSASEPCAGACPHLGQMGTNNHVYYYKWQPAPRRQAPQAAPAAASRCDAGRWFLSSTSGDARLLQSVTSKPQHVTATDHFSFNNVLPALSRRLLRCWFTC